MSEIKGRVPFGRRQPVDSGDAAQVLRQISGNTAAGNTVSLYNNPIAAAAGEVLNVENTATVYIPVDKIYPNPLNKPYIEEITDKEFEALKESILSHGLLHNLVVLDDGRGRYRLISGEKRWTAIKRMTREEYEEKMPKGVETKVLPYNSELDETDEHILLLTCNVLVFSSGTPDARQLRDLIKLYIKKGYKNKHLVEFLNVYLESSNNHIYKLIQEAKAIEPFVKLYEDKKITRSALQIFGSLKESEQKEIYEKILREGIDKIDETLAQDLKKRIKDSKKEDKKDSGQRSIAFIKYEKNLESMEASIEKFGKVKVKDMEGVEKELLKARLALLAGKIAELEEGLS